MKKAAIAAALALLPAGGCSEGAKGGKIQWRDGGKFDAALAEARSTGLPLMLYFTADG